MKRNKKYNYALQHKEGWNAAISLDGYGANKEEAYEMARKKFENMNPGMLTRPKEEYHLVLIATHHYA